MPQSRIFLKMESKNELLRSLTNYTSFILQKNCIPIVLQIQSRKQIYSFAKLRNMSIRPSKALVHFLKACYKQL